MSKTNTQQNVEIKIDGQTVVCQQGESIIQAADRHGVYIPRFCYHDKLSVVANCRMCLVEVGNCPKTMPACATTVTPNMEVYTQSKKTRDAQKAVMQFLLVNHPLDCPICDQGGECDLQDVAMGFGEGCSTFTGKKRAVKDENLGPFIATEMTRCIHCTRCIRFGDEIAGLPELALTQRGGQSAVSTFLQHGVHSELSGNMIDLCPVGALTSKPFRFHGRSWGYEQHHAIAPHDCIGSNLYMHVNNTDEDGQMKVMRVVPKQNDEVNDQWISDIDRFSYQAIHSSKRLQHPMIKNKGVWQEVSWFDALSSAALGMRQVVEKHGAEQIAGLMSPSSSLEEGYLFQKVMRSQGVVDIDHRLRCLDDSYVQHEGLHTGFGMTLNQLQAMDHFMIIGGDLRRHQPMLNHRIRTAQLGGAQVTLLHGYDPDYNFELANYLSYHPNEWCEVLLALIQVALGRKKAPNGIEKLLKDVTASERAKQQVAIMREAKSPVIILGLEAYHHPLAGRIRALAEHLAILLDGQVCSVTDGSNSSGMWLSGVVPSRGAFAAGVASQGKLAVSHFAEPKRGYWLHQFSPMQDSIQPSQAMAALKQADFVVACSSFDDDQLKEVADVLLPIALPAECSGTYVNAEGRWQFSQAAIMPCHEAKPAWKVYRVLGNYWHVEGIKYNHLEDVAKELECLQQESMIPEVKPMPNYEPLAKVELSWTLLPVWTAGCQDMMVRHSESLQQLNPVTIAYLNTDDLRDLKLEVGQKIELQQGQYKVTLACAEDDSIAAKTIVLMIGGDGVIADFENCFGAVNVRGV